MRLPSLTLRAEPRHLQCLPEGFSASRTSLTMAVFIFGTNVAWLLFGFLVAQIYTYYTRPSKDHPLIKALVYGTVFIVIAESALEDFINWYSLVSNWGKPGLFDDPFTAASIMDDLQPFFSAFCGIIVQSFFTWRIWTFSMAIYRRKAVRFLVAAICLFILLTSICAFASALTVIGLQFASESQQISIAIALLTWTVLTAVVDVTITVCMVTILRHAKSSAYFGETHHILSRLLRLTIQTGFLTSVLAIPIAPLYIQGTHQSVIFALPYYWLGKSYAISLSANLNARSNGPPPIHIQGPENDGGDNARTAPLSSMGFATGRIHGHSEVNAASGSGILGFARSIVHTIHRDLTTIPPEDAPQPDTEVHSSDVDGHPGPIHTGVAEREEIS